MPRGKVAGIIRYNGKILVGRRYNRKGFALSGEWDIPTIGKLDGESDAEALERMAKTNLGIELNERMCISSIGEEENFVRWYECYSNSLNVKCGKGWEEAEWVEKEEVINRVKEDIRRNWPSDVRSYFGRVG